MTTQIFGNIQVDGETEGLSDFVPLEDEEWREYDFGESGVIHINNPVAMAVVLDTEQHLVIDRDGVHYMIDWNYLAVRWKVKKAPTLKVVQ